MRSVVDSAKPAAPEDGKIRTGRQLLLPAVIGVVVLIVVIRTLLGYPLFTTSSYNGNLIEPPAVVPAITLIASDGSPVALSDFEGQLILLYFGYTFCPDICPATLGKLASAIADLTPQQQAQIQVVMVTVDPERDTPEQLAAYLAFFDASFIGLSGSAAQIAAAAEPFGIFYEKHDGTAASGYLVDHTTSVIALDTAGQWRMTLPYALSRDQLAADLKQLLRE